MGSLGLGLVGLEKSPARTLIRTVGPLQPDLITHERLRLLSLYQTGGWGDRLLIIVEG